MVQSNQNIVLVIASQYQLDSALSFLDKTALPLIIDRRYISLLRYFLKLFYLFIIVMIKRRKFDNIMVGDRRSLVNRIAHLVPSRQKIIISDGAGDVIDEAYYDDATILKLTKKIIFSCLPNYEFKKRSFDFDLRRKPRHDAVWVIGQCLSERGDMSVQGEMELHQKLARTLSKKAACHYLLHPKDSEQKRHILSQFYDEIIDTCGFEDYVKNAASLPAQMVTFYSTAAFSLHQLGYSDVMFVKIDELADARKADVRRVHQDFLKYGFKEFNV